MGGVPKRGMLSPMEPCKAVARADWPGPGDEFGPPRPARGVEVPDPVPLVDSGRFEPAGEEARRAVKAARLTEFVVGDLAWLGVA